ncbi:4a-hydroxytetrahydrobiopterin dehydratase [Leptospira yasudae]|uniref:4a-hydroxytetrahydrobiopterin dehydratase n=1 Tax=Leptospira yasudae TaxID=2202201 RepID=A0A6N4QIQ8_9LEPT|nr:4a-hydroxytetrahydrobiopterin dehydratase [Leptospira yasudae]TGL78061.1 4a-hydroxytetrahydrobiopterin dehydratase [Leptospira yasudae]TGL81345.1 4a-hydroxytetrahydrobiopterin dehydratase [Leptospira yasudae]TGL81477.1 4a-hydroxytetrahydrobiopterin dehydratase [Leptospira yasudae]
MNDRELQDLKEKIPSGWEVRFRENVPFLYKTYSFNEYMGGVEFVNALANIAERMDHHPDLFLTYRKVAVEIFTHSKNSVTDLDLRFVQEAEKVYKV